jgi:hypothetical protein
MDEKKESLIASTHGGVVALATGSDGSSASRSDIQLILNLNTKIEFLTRHARDAYDVLLDFIFTPITAISGSQRWLGGW